MASRAWLGDALLVAGLKTAISAAVLHTGFRALSDDDFARIVIAEGFAYAPSFDPSGSSWLPFPFWLQGGAMMSFGRSVTTARVTAFVLGILAAVLLLVAARWLGASRRAAIVGAVVASAFPYAAWLGVATIPEALTGAFVVFGIASLSEGAHARFLGALCLSLACLSRYEPWPVALIFAVFCGLDAVREKKPVLFAPAAVAVSGAVLWLVHGALTHHDPLFFIQRVAAYRRAVGGGGQSFVHALFAYPLMLLRCEPEVAALGFVAATALALKRRAAAWARYRRSAVALAGMLVFLVVGELRDGAPTHHAERALFAIWSFVALFAVQTLFELFRERANRLALGGAVIALVALGAVVIRPWYARRDSFIDRSDEVAIGKLARSSSSPVDRLLVEHPDFGFYAVIAGFGAPERAEPLDDHDPRSPRTQESVLDRAQRERARLVVLSRDRIIDTSQRRVGSAGRFVLVRVFFP